MSELVPDINAPVQKEPKKRKKNFKKGLLITLIILLISPFDLSMLFGATDFVPILGWIDDVGYILGIIGTIISMIAGRKKK